MKVVFFTNEYPPYIYGGAGVHVDYLTRELSKLCDVEVHAFGDQQAKSDHLSATGHQPWRDIACADKRFQKAIEAMTTDIHMAANISGADIVHCHTWYTHFAGLIARSLYQAPMVITTHSFEPSRPWKVEQLGNAYYLSSWIERTAMEQADGIIAVSNGMKRDALRHFSIDPKTIDVIYNGIDLDEYQTQTSTEALEKYHVERNRPYVLFVGRITRQKGIIHLVNAIRHINKETAIVLCAGAPDTPEIAEEMRKAVAEAKKRHPHVTWIEEMVAKKDVIQLYSHATVFCCPSVYEPFGIINLEAMACETPVVGAAVGGIPEIIVNDETGYLVPFEPVSIENTEPKNPEKFSLDLATKINILLSDSEKCRTFGKSSRKRVEDIFSWKAIAKETLAYYQKVIARSKQK